MPSDGDLLDAITALDRLAAWTHAQQARLLAAFAARRPGDDPMLATGDTPNSGSRWAPDELGLALGRSRHTARALLAEATILTDTLPDVLTALETGQIDPGKARVLCELVPLLGAGRAAAVTAHVLARAGTQPWSRFRAAVRRAILRVDPDGARRRHTRARADRRVSVRPDEDGMATLWALLPAEEATASWQMLTRLARGLDRPGDPDPRTLDARRADLLVDLLTGRLTLTTDTDPDSSDSDPHPHPDPHADVGDVGDGDVGDPDDGGERLGSTGAGSPAGRAGSGTPSHPAKPTHPGPSPAPARAPVVHIGPTTALVHVVVGLDTLLGACDHPAELVGHGPLPATTARAIAAGGTWKRLVTDPLSGVLLDHGRTTYRPPTALREFVMARDHTCRFPGCTRRARDGDLDHLDPWAAGGTTDATNLHDLCPHHHRLKDQPGWQVLALHDGRLLWTTPTGTQHLSAPYDHREHLPDTDEPAGEPPAA